MNDHPTLPVSFFMQPSGDSRGGEALTDGMDSGEYVSTVDSMDPTLAELGDEFTLGDIDGKLIKALLLVLFVLFVSFCFRQV